MTKPRGLETLTLRVFLEEVEDPRRGAMLAIYDKYRELFHYSAGSSHNHQAWEGGYADHIAECLRINTVYYDALEMVRPVPFTEDQALICLFLHDIEKPFKYGPEDHPECQKWRALGHKAWAEAQETYSSFHPGEPTPSDLRPTWEQMKWAIIVDLMVRFKFDLDADEVNALKYCHGEGNDYQKTRRIQLPLAAHVHHCDNTSARIWFDKGKGLT